MNATMAATGALPPLPEYSLQPLPPLVPGIADKHLALVLPIIAYWAVSMMFHLVDVYDLFPQYRLHTPAEVLKRNRVSRWDVVRDVVVQQIIQTIVGVVLSWTEEDVEMGKDEYNVAAWALRLRVAQTYVPSVLALVGLDSKQLAANVTSKAPLLAGFLAGGQYPWLVKTVGGSEVPDFASWETRLASFIYWVGLPALQFAVAIVIVDTWQYFLHRAMHLNRWLYVKFHSRHHRLYVPYAYGALYNHPVEGFLLDTLGTGIAYLVVGMTPRQSMWFFSCSTIKTVDDHCGYALPWDPLQHISSNNAGYHDVHHQSWGIKSNFSQPFFTFWDHLLGTVWTGGDISARYERGRLAAQKLVDEDAAKKNSSITGSSAADSVAASSNSPYEKPEVVVEGALPEAPAGKAALQADASRAQVVLSGDAGGIAAIEQETAEEQAEQAQLRRSPRKATGRASDASPAPLKGLRDRVNSGAKSFHGRSGSILGYNGQ